MTWLALAILTICFCALSTHFLIAAILDGPIYQRTDEFSIMALRLGRLYRIISWSVVTLALLATIIGLFLHAAYAFL